MQPARPSFSIILPTYNRPELALRAVESVLAQSGDLLAELVVVNDSPDAQYGDLEARIQDETNVTYLRNEANQGKNVSTNRALQHVREHGTATHVIFLDDDDWLSETCFADFARSIEAYPSDAWHVSARAYPSGAWLTVNKTGRDRIRYIRDYLLLRRFSGDATHCIQLEVAAACTFPVQIRNGEEWLYFSSVASTVPTFRYVPTIGTYSGGYLDDGLTKEINARYEQTARYRAVRHALNERGGWTWSIRLYMGLRFIRMLF